MRHAGKHLKTEIWEKVTLARLGTRFWYGNWHFPVPFVLYLHTWLLIINSWPVNIWQGLSSNLHALQLNTVCFCFPKAGWVCASVYVHVHEKERGIRNAQTLKMVTWWSQTIPDNCIGEIRAGRHIFLLNTFLKVYSVDLFLEVNLSALQTDKMQ